MNNMAPCCFFSFTGFQIFVPAGALHAPPYFQVVGVNGALFTAPAGVGLALAVWKRQLRWPIAGLVLSVFGHAVYDVLLARGWGGGAISSLWILVLWIGVIVAAPRLAKLPLIKVAPG